ncbi:Rib/alpha-like domain-containing protein, partial [Streptococcus pluranimalium]|uniref:Rib/alpha-like domain-containing protein n=1 Tax=Streptococcus pluranimalium TaxID=82348 RepID=UPI0039E79E73
VSVAIDRGGNRAGSGLDWLVLSQDNLDVEGNATTERPYTVKLSGEVPKDTELKDGEARFTHYLTAKDTAGNQSTDNYRKAGSPGEFVIVVKPQTDKYTPKLTNQTPVSTTVGTPVDTQAILDKVTVPGKDDVKKTVTKTPDANTLGKGFAEVTVEYPDKSTDTIEVPVN